MDILFLLIPMSLVLVFIIGGIFWWSLRHGQFDDLEGPGYRILMDDDSVKSADSATRPVAVVSAGAATPSPPAES